ncbi:MAG: aminotransferase class I/II-fold pyridoxal phosphate-dependent enzyme [Acidobacteriia bacterium]|nr:aminotransferase class I/II-fold pyridoxal phosphate-dependent enzyme [Terriglobia bacterium]
MPKVQPVNNLHVVQAAARLDHVRYAIRDLAVVAERLAREGKTILPLNIGDPLNFDFRTPPHLIEAVNKAMRDGRDGYAPSLGVPEAIEAIRAEAERKGIRNIQSVFLTAGVSEAVDVCLTALVNRGENVLSPSPEYPLYSAVLAKLDAQPNSYSLDEEADWEPDLEDIERRIFTGTRAILVINPNNPTGAVYSRKTLERIAELARQNNLVIFSDEIYDKLILDGEPHTSLAALAPDVPVVTFNGLSKSYLVPGWRVGWAVVSGEVAAVKPYLEGVHQLLRARLCSSHPQQYAVRPALEGPQDHLGEVLSKLRARRDLTVSRCRATPHVSCVTPRGAFYAFPRIEISDSDRQFVRQLLIEKQVLVVHGGGFGQAPGTKHFRIVFLPDEATLERAYQGLRAFIEEHYA